MGRKMILTAVAVAFAFAAAGPAAAAGWANPELLPSAKELKAKMGSADWVIVDCRDLKDYAKGHIEGAISLGKRCKKALRDKTSRVFRDLSTYEKLLGKVGISNDVHVVFYGEHKVTDTVRDSAIAFWILEYLGHDKVHVLDGGIDGWKKAGFGFTQTPTIRPEATFTAKPVPSRYATTAEMVEIGSGEKTGVQVIDSRTSKENKGQDIRAIRGGRLPGTTINVSHKDVLDQKKDPKTGKMVDTGFISPDRVGGFFKDLDKSKRTVAYCQTGSRSGWTYLQLRLLGFEDPANWDESWRVYASHPSNYPVEGEQWFDFNRVRTLEKTVKKLEKELAKQSGKM